jgi:hypothetical protein
MIPSSEDDNGNNKEILKEIEDAENFVSKGIDQQQKEYDQRLKGTSTSSCMRMKIPEAGIIYDKYAGIKNICKKFGLAEG